MLQSPYVPKYILMEKWTSAGCFNNFILFLHSWFIFEAGGLVWFLYRATLITYAQSSNFPLLYYYTKASMALQ